MHYKLMLQDKILFILLLTTNIFIKNHKYVHLILFKSTNIRKKCLTVPPSPHIRYTKPPLKWVRDGQDVRSHTPTSREVVSKTWPLDQAPHKILNPVIYSQQAYTY